MNPSKRKKKKKRNTRISYANLLFQGEVLQRFFSFERLRRFVHPGLFSRSSKRSRKADIPRDVSCDANTYRLFTRPAIFEAIRQSDIRESFRSATSQRKVAPWPAKEGDAFCPAIPSFLFPAE